MAPPKKVNLEKAAKQVVEKAKKLGPFIEVRVVEKAQYGYPYAILVERGDVIRYYVKDLTYPARSGENPTNGREWKSVEYEGKTYSLPSWAVDVNDEVEEVDEEELVATISGRPIKRVNSDDDESDDVI